MMSGPSQFVGESFPNSRPQPIKTIFFVTKELSPTTVMVALIVSSQAAKHRVVSALDTLGPGVMFSQDIPSLKLTAMGTHDSFIF